VPVGTAERLDDINAELDTIEVHLERAGSTGAHSVNRSQTVRIGRRAHLPSGSAQTAPVVLPGSCLVAGVRDPAATERLARHQHEMTVDRPSAQQSRAIGTSAVVGLVPPACRRAVRRAR
jgi:hypothetical protein